VVRAKPVEKQGNALAYLRTSSAQNVGGDSDQRQREAIERFAQAHGYELVGEFYDAAVSGADPIESRPGFAAMLERIEGNGVRVVLVEDASRFARSVIAQELGVLAMQVRGVRVLTSSGEDLTSTDDPAKVMMRQIAGAFAQYEKTRLVAKLKGARDRKSAQLG
jgi:DNA invertase Pin-like site-specific DNA recombinase